MLRVWRVLQPPYAQLMTSQRHDMILRTPEVLRGSTREVTHVKLQPQVVLTHSLITRSKPAVAIMFELYLFQSTVKASVECAARARTDRPTANRHIARSQRVSGQGAATRPLQSSIFTEQSPDAEAAMLAACGLH